MQFGYFFSISVIIQQMKLTSPLGDLPAHEFLAQYWQKKPLLIRQAFKDFTSPISAEELAGLACDEMLESRIIIEKDGRHPWELRTGPFAAQDFTRLPDTHWTLLIQDIEKHLPELTCIIDAFHFIPDWRLDDLMISYAPEYGSVGPHVDAYDVFLLQAQGKRQWKINTHIDADAPMLDITALNILQDFEVEQEWILEPGDILYLPPGVAHYGISLGDCITCSIGFRAPTHVELVQSYLQTVIEQIQADKHFSDPDLCTQQFPHEITLQSVAQLKQTVADYLSLDPQSLYNWAGTLLSEGKEGFQAESVSDQPTMSGFIRRWQASQVLYRNTALKFLYITADDTLHFYIDGQHIDVAARLSDYAEWLCSSLEISWDKMNRYPDREALLSVMHGFYCRGFYYF
jgi:50S ribosomal protein L16 3-hydroxylase